ncbi:MAG: thioesterase family protein [Dermatophilaceae bacterium]
MDTVTDQVPIEPGRTEPTPVVSRRFGAGYSVDIPLRWSDMDAFGHVNNVHWARLLEQARVQVLLDWFGELGEEILRGGIVVVHQELEYLEQLEYRRQPVRVDVWVQSMSRTSYDLAYAVRDPDEVGTTLYLLAETTLVCIDAAAGRPRPLGEGERDVLTGHLADPVPLRRRQRG